MAYSEILIKDIEERAQCQLLYDEGSFWVYDGETGIWRKKDEDEVKRLIIYSSRWIEWWNGPVNMTDNMSNAIMSMMQSLCSHTGIFTNEEPGVCFANGRVSVRNEKLVISDLHPRFLSRNCLSFNFIDGKDGSKPERWLSFLDEAFEGDNQKTKALGEFVGVCLAGMATSYDKALMLVGAGGNGKSIVCEVVRRLFGDHQVSSVSPQSMEDPVYVSALHGALLNLVTDIPTRNMRDTGTFKQVVSGDAVVGKQLYRQPYTFKPRAGHMFSANMLPVAPDTSHGFFRRWVVLEFNKKFEGAQQIPRDVLLGELEQELPKIAKWALEHYIEVRKGKMTEPTSSQKAVKRWMLQANSVKAFVVLRTKELDDDSDIDHLQMEHPDSLYRKYKEWAGTNGFKPVSSIEFRRRMQSAGFELSAGKYPLAAIPITAPDSYEDIP